MQGVSSSFIILLLALELRLEAIDFEDFLLDGKEHEARSGVLDALVAEDRLLELVDDHDEGQHC